MNILGVYLADSSISSSMTETSKETTSLGELNQQKGEGVEGESLGKVYAI